MADMFNATRPASPGACAEAIVLLAWSEIRRDGGKVEARGGGW